MPKRGVATKQAGRLLSEEAYKKDTKEFRLLDEKEGGMSIDLIRSEGEEVDATYLYRLKKLGIVAKGVLLFPKEKKKVEVVLTEELEKELISAQRAIKDMLSRVLPPEQKRVK